MDDDRAHYNLIEEEDECINILLNDSRVVQVLDSTATSTSAATTSAATTAVTIATTSGDLISIGFAFFLLFLFLFLSSIFFHISTIGTCKKTRERLLTLISSTLISKARTILRRLYAFTVFYSLLLIS